MKQTPYPGDIVQYLRPGANELTFVTILRTDEETQSFFGVCGDHGHVIGEYSTIEGVIGTASPAFVSEEIRNCTALVDKAIPYAPRFKAKTDEFEKSLALVNAVMDDGKQDREWHIARAFIKLQEALGITLADALIGWNTVSAVATANPYISQEQGHDFDVGAEAARRNYFRFFPND